MSYNEIWTEFCVTGSEGTFKKRYENEVVLLDATETPIERPKKDKNTITQVKRKDTR